MATATSPRQSNASGPARKESHGGFFHSFKRAVFSGDHVPDHEFDAAVRDFKVMHQYVSNLRRDLTAFMTNMKGILHSSMAITGDFADILAEVPKPHPFSNQVQDLKRAHGDLISDKGEAAITRVLEDTTSRRINEELAEHQRLFQRIEQRMKLRDDFDYYTKKVNELKTERDKRTAKGKAEGKSDLEKWDRNQGKLNEAKDAYMKFNHDLMQDLLARYQQRLGAYGPAMAEFLSAERQLVLVYANALKDVAAPDEKSGVADGLGRTVNAVANAAKADVDVQNQSNMAAEAAVAPTGVPVLPSIGEGTANPATNPAASLPTTAPPAAAPVATGPPAISSPPPFMPDMPHISQQFAVQDTTGRPSSGSVAGALPTVPPAQPVAAPPSAQPQYNDPFASINAAAVTSLPAPAPVSNGTSTPPFSAVQAGTPSLPAGVFDLQPGSAPRPATPIKAGAGSNPFDDDGF